MPMTMVVTRDVAPRIRGFLASTMLEIAPGVYTSPRMNRAVRERVWGVVEEWFDITGGGSIVMTWADTGKPEGLGIRTIGTPPISLKACDGIILARRRYPDGGGKESSKNEDL